MSSEDPTLKIRLQLPGTATHLGRDCYDVAKCIVGDGGTVLDAKWGREPSKWRDTGGWGRPKLAPHQRGYIDAVRELSTDDCQRTLVEIIDSLTKGTA